MCQSDLQLIAVRDVDVPSVRKGPPVTTEELLMRVAGWVVWGWGGGRGVEAEGWREQSEKQYILLHYVSVPRAGWSWVMSQEIGFINEAWEQSRAATAATLYPPGLQRAVSLARIASRT